MSGKVFDTEISGLPDLELKIDPAQMVEPTTDQKEGDELILPEEKEVNPYSMKTSEIFVMRKKEMKKKKEKQEVERNIKLEVIPEDGIIEEKEIDDLQFKMDEEVKTKRGKRGNDKKPRKKRVMTDKQKENLRKAREKSLAVRRAKKAAKQEEKNKNKKISNSHILRNENKIVKEVSQPKDIPRIPVANSAPMSFDYFCDLMDRYENRKAKKHSTTREPHPNKIIPHQAKPRPPIQKVQRNQVKVNPPHPIEFDPYTILQKRQGSLFGSAFGY
tara:strand:- start:1050 stop:1868 length:819 start_codon:yes stop_codon:yes gene_type:complete